MVTLMVALIGPATVLGQGAAEMEESGKTAAVPPAVPPSLTDGDADVAACNGPTVRLSYGPKTLETSRMSSFMYFVPLISPVAVGRETGVRNDQRVAVVSYDRRVTSKSFCVTCEFEMLGDGFTRYLFDPTGMIATRAAALTKGDTLANVLEYIHFEGTGFGSLRIRGSVDDGVETVREVDLRFNERGRRSPVTIGLYDVKCDDGRYRYENRCDELVARVNTLTFKRSEKPPRMDITVASIGRKKAGGFFGQVKGALTNLFLKPVSVDPRGNDAMLQFGYALLRQEPAFTFPKAGNLKEFQIAAADPNPGDDRGEDRRVAP